MFRASLLAIPVTMSLLLASAYSSGGSQRIVDRLFQYADEQNIEALSKMKSTIIGSRDPRLKATYWLAFFEAKRGQLDEGLIEGFPTTVAGVDGLYRAYEDYRKSRGNVANPFVAIEKSALGGNDIAEDRVIKAEPHSDGAITEGFDETITRLLIQRTAEGIAKLSAQSASVTRGTLCRIMFLAGPQERKEIVQLALASKQKSTRAQTTVQMIVSAAQRCAPKIRQGST